MTLNKLELVHEFQLVDESGAIEIMAVGCQDGTLMDYGGQFYQLSDGEKLEVMGRVIFNASGFVVELDRAVPSSELPRVTLPKAPPSR